MALTTAQFSITTTPAQIYSGDGANEIHLHTGGAIFIGDSTVSSTTGLRMDSGDKLTFSLHESPVYAVAASGSQPLYVMVISK